MIALMRWIAGFLTIIIFAGFAALNRQDVALYFSPIHDAVQIPLFIIILGFAAAGFLIGSMAVWFNDGKLRREKRLQKKQIKTLESELEMTQKIMSAKDRLHDPLFPALTKH